MPAYDTGPGLLNRAERTPGLGWAAILLVALSLSIGWGVRGNWGHEYGAMIPGAMSAMAACLVAGRKDWRRRIVFFAFFGALSWSFGGSMAYMHLIAYTHSGHRETVFYGFACLFLVGFLWGAVGGAGTVLSAFLDRERLTELFIPVTLVLFAWALEGLALSLADLGHDALAKAYGQTVANFLTSLVDNPFTLYDVDWLAALLAIFVTVGLCIVRRRVCRGSSLVLHLAIGWWLGFTILTLALQLRMLPPKSDNWAGSLGMTIGMFVYLWRNGLAAVALAALGVGFFAGLGFSGATLIKLVSISHYVLTQQPSQTNWHSILEQTFGFISGLGVALVMGWLSTRAPRLSDDPPVRRWTEPFALVFVLLVITYLNIRKNVDAVWLPNQIVPKSMHGVSIQGWFDIAYLLVALTVAALFIARRMGRRIPLVPTDWLGKGQLLYLTFLWWIVLGNLSRLAPLHESRLVTEGVIHLNACLCTLLVIFVPREEQPLPERPAPYYMSLVRRLAVAALIGALFIVAAEGAVVRSIYGDTFTGHNFSGPHIRFGPDATIHQGQ